MLNKDNLKKFLDKIDNTTRGYKHLRGLYITVQKYNDANKCHSGIVTTADRNSAKLLIMSTKSRHIEINKDWDILAVYKIFTVSNKDYYIEYDASIAYMVEYIRYVRQSILIHKSYTYDLKFESYSSYLLINSNSERVHKLIYNVMDLIAKNKKEV